MALKAERPRTQAERRNKSEQALLTAAAALIADLGIEQASLARIGERAGTSRGLPSHHFGSKDELVARLARRVQDHVEAATLKTLEAMHQTPDDVSALEFLRTTVETYLAHFENPTDEERALIVMWGATFPSQASIDGMLDADQRSYDGWADLIRRGQLEASIRADVDAGAAAVVLFGLMRGVAALLLTESEIRDMGRVRSTCDALIMAALGVPVLGATPSFRGGQ